MPAEGVADLEADRLRALMRAAVFKQPHQPVMVGRFEVVKLLGSGAMGIVYEAFDPRRGDHVALKTLRSASARALSLFKREFRALSRLSHPNLVALYEMGRDHDQYFFTMELVRGSTLLKYLWGSDAFEPCGVTPVTDFGRLRAVFAQLVDGVYALHQAHKLHRDIKPTNVMVTPQGRVVLMDFGFVGEESVGTLESTAGSLVVGTPAYMAPEQATGGDRTAASDWYSVGATLYIALTGQVPFHGDNLAVMMERKQQEPPPPPRTLASGIPEDLDALCARLLQPDPKARPDAPELLAFFHGDRAHIQRVSAAYPSPAATHVGARSFVGRTAEVRALRLAFDVVDHPGAAAVPTIVLIGGRAGTGKSALVRHVTDGLRQRAAVLRARCYERDTVPYKALDSLIDALARHLRQRDEAEVARALPTELAALVALFPVLHQAPAVAAVTPAPSDSPGKRDLATALRPDAPAFRALRRLLVALSAQRPLAVWIDDLQWGDADSVRALAELLRPPAPPRALVIASYRSDDAGSPAVRALQVLRDMVDAAGSKVQDLELAPLSPDETLALAEILLGPDTPPQRLRKLAAEADGSPQLLHELARFVAHGADSSPEVTLDELIEIRISRLTPSQRRMLELLAVAGRPLPQPAALAAAGAGPGGLADLQQLQGASLVRRLTTDGDDALDLQHERARDAVLTRLDGPDLRELHGRLAAALAADPHVDPLALTEHLRAAGEPARAHALAVRAAAAAREAGDFLRAADLLRAARELAPPASAPAIARDLAEALARAGRGREAADAYLAARTGDAIADLGLAGAAAAHLMITGHLRRGRETLGQALASAGLEVGAASVRGRLGALWRRGQRLVRGEGFTERREADVLPLELARVDLCFAAAVSALVTDPGAAADAQAHHLHLALRAGEPRRVARALALEACLLAALGAAARGRMQAQLASARALAQRCGAAAIADLADLVAVLAATGAGDSAGALALADPLIRAGTAHAAELPGIAALARMCQLRALFLLGRYPALRAEVPGLLLAARAADDRAAQVACGSVAAWLHAVDGDLAAARAEVDACAAAWTEPPERGYSLQHLQLLVARVNVHLAAGEPREAWARVEAEWPLFSRSGIRQILPLKTQAADLAGRAALAALRAGGPAEPLRRAADRSATDLHDDGARGHAALQRAALSALAGDAAGAHGLVQAAAEAFTAAGLAGHAAAARLRLARMRGKGEPEAHAAALALGVARPELLADVLAPGL